MTTVDELLGKLELLDAPRRVLVVEDQLVWLQTLTGFLEARGHKVIPMTGVLDVTSDSVDGLGIDGQQIEPSPKLADIDFVFLDFHFAGNKHNGASFLQQFRQHSQALVMGMSSDAGLNSVLKILGATFTMQKNRLKSVLYE